MNCNLFRPCCSQETKWVCVGGGWGGWGVGKRGRGLEPWRISNKFTGKKKKQKREKQWKQRQWTVLSSWFCRWSWTVSFSHQVINCSHPVASKKITLENAQMHVQHKLRLWLSLRTKNVSLMMDYWITFVHVTLHWTFIHPETFLPCMLHFAVSLIVRIWASHGHAASGTTLWGYHTFHLGTFLHFSTSFHSVSTWNLSVLQSQKHAVNYG